MAEGIKEVLRRNMSSALNRGDLAQAANLLERLQEEDPLSVETRGMELEYLIRRGKLRDAETLAEQLLDWFCSSPRIHYLAGQVAYRLKEYKRAAERFRESQRLSPHWRSSLLLAKSLTQLGELDEAASIFESLLPEHRECYRDLAWLYERRQDYRRALTAIETYVTEYSEDEFAKAQHLRLRARMMDPDELISDAHQLMEFGEEVPETVMPQYLEALFRTGKAGQVHQFVAQRRANLSPHAAASAGWVCYRYQAYDLAVELFIPSFDIRNANAKFLSALEFAATRSGRVADLIRLYESRTTDDPRLFGRIESLKRRFQTTNADRKT